MTTKTILVYFEDVPSFIRMFEKSGQEYRYSSGIRDNVIDIL